ncbi:MAG: IMP dehydrogenase, partial [Planctomycetes bacterium]|nr:IMP dehydrogenase [Planctomycetota bacterium]
MPARPGAPEPAASCIVDDALAFDDVLLVPRRSSVLPEEIDTTTLLTPNIKLNIPL